MWREESRAELQADSDLISATLGALTASGQYATSIDPVLLIGESWRIWPSEWPELNLRALRADFAQHHRTYPSLPTTTCLRWR